MNCEKRLNDIIKKWFITEPLLFSVVTNHHFVNNESLSVPLRTGHHCIEFSEVITNQLSENEISAELSDAAAVIQKKISLLNHLYSREQSTV